MDVFTWPSHGSIIAMNERFQLINACVDTEPWRRQVLRLRQARAVLGRGLRHARPDRGRPQLVPVL